MIPRLIEQALLRATKTLPVVSLTGPRQSGKSTILKALFSDYRYINMEDPLLLANAQDDPRGFLDDIGYPVIIDEVQRFPELFSFLQLKVDEINKPGMYILSGSQNFLMLEAIGQSLAGRVSVLRLYPFLAKELMDYDDFSLSTEEWVFKGAYPRLYDVDIEPKEYYPSYIETYLQRDVRTLKNVGDLTSFTRFLQILAGRVGQLLVYQDLADAADISVKTVKSWLSILETSYVVTLLSPMHRNVTSRNVKSPKLYFVDTGLACSLLGITEASQVRAHYLYSALFENMVVMEAVKYTSSVQSTRALSFWRNNKKQEIDLLVEKSPAEVEIAMEIKASRSEKLSHFSALDKVGEVLELPTTERYVVYDGKQKTAIQKHGVFLPWKQMVDLLN